MTRNEQGVEEEVVKERWGCTERTDDLGAVLSTQQLVAAIWSAKWVELVFEIAEFNPNAFVIRKLFVIKNFLRFT